MVISLSMGFGGYACAAVRLAVRFILVSSLALSAAGQNPPQRPSLSRPNEPRTLSSEEIQPLIRAVAENDIANDLKNFNVVEDVSYRDYKKFRSDTKIVPVPEEPR